MRRIELKVTGVVFLLIMLTGGIEQVQAQQKYPTKAIEIICPWNAGGSTDMSSRVMADFLRKEWGVPVNVVNKPGGNTVPALLELYNAKPDGYTMLQDGQSSSCLLPAGVKNLPFKIMDRTFIGIISTSPYFVIVASDSPIKSMKDVEAEAKKDPGNFTWTSLGGASAYDYAMRKFMKAIGVDINKTRPVMSKAGTEVVSHITSGAVKMGYLTPALAGPTLAAKLLRPVAFTGIKRHPKYPDVPTIAEAGYPAAAYYDRYGPVGPPNLSSHNVEVWEKALEQMLKDPEIISKMERIGLMPFYINARDYRELVSREMEEIKEFWGVK